MLLSERSKFAGATTAETEASNEEYQRRMKKLRAAQDQEEKERAGEMTTMMIAIALAHARGPCSIRHLSSPCIQAPAFLDPIHVNSSIAAREEQQRMSMVKSQQKDIEEAIRSDEEAMRAMVTRWVPCWRCLAMPAHHPLQCFYSLLLRPMLTQ